jgi:hypothetical protein
MGGQTAPCPTCKNSLTRLPDIAIPPAKVLETTSMLAPESTPSQTSAEQPQSKSEWVEWIALNERVRKRRILSGILLSEEIAWEPQKTSSPHVVQPSNLEEQ